MILLAIDTSASLCAAGVFSGQRELGRHVIDIGKGHAEHLMPVIEAALANASVTYQHLEKIAVAVGPGSFTGIRVGVATARGLALALKIPVIGISNLEAVAELARKSHPDRAVLVAFASARGNVQAALYDPFANLVYHPHVTDLEHATRLAADHNAVVAGSAALAIAAAAPGLIVAAEAVTVDISVCAHLASNRAAGEKPTPLYLREPDAKPQTGFALPRSGR